MSINVLLQYSYSVEYRRNVAKLVHAVTNINALEMISIIILMSKGNGHMSFASRSFAHQFVSWT